MLTDEFNETTYQSYLEEHKIMASLCADCGNAQLPPRAMCPDCFSQNITWKEIRGSGKLEAYTTVYIAPSAMIAAGYGRTNPYCVGVVRLDDGPAISAQLVGIDPAHPENISIGASLEAAFVERGESQDKKTFLVFEKK